MVKNKLLTYYLKYLNIYYKEYRTKAGVNMKIVINKKEKTVDKLIREATNGIFDFPYWFEMAVDYKRLKEIADKQKTNRKGVINAN